MQSVKMQSVRALPFSLVLLLLGSIGCGGGPQVGELTGQVTFQGKPLDRGMVSFFPSTGRPIGAAIEPDGTYRVTLPPDTYGVIVMAPPKLPPGFKEGDPLPPDPNPIPTRYGRKETSGLTATVDAGTGAQTADFALE